jgi:hypothetical protein
MIVVAVGGRDGSISGFEMGDKVEGSDIGETKFGVRQGVNIGQWSGSKDGTDQGFVGVMVGLEGAHVGLVLPDQFSSLGTSTPGRNDGVNWRGSRSREGDTSNF